jgi:hypothetical protein
MGSGDRVERAILRSSACCEAAPCSWRNTRPSRSQWAAACFASTDRRATGLRVATPESADVAPRNIKSDSRFSVRMVVDGCEVALDAHRPRCPSRTPRRRARPTRPGECDQSSRGTNRSWSCRPDTSRTLTPPAPPGPTGASAVAGVLVDSSNVARHGTLGTFAGTPRSGPSLRWSQGRRRRGP